MERWVLLAVAIVGALIVLPGLYPEAVRTVLSYLPLVMLVTAVGLAWAYPDKAWPWRR